MADIENEVQEFVEYRWEIPSWKEAQQKSLTQSKKVHSDCFKILGEEWCVVAMHTP
jgi:hypothetical protein